MHNACSKEVTKAFVMSWLQFFSEGSFAGMGFLAMYLVGKFDIKGKGVALRFFVIFAPLGLATAIAVTRLDDYMHRWQDVLVGAIIGTKTMLVSLSQRLQQ